eukprot:5669075-Amphidinium_carterae.1
MQAFWQSSRRHGYLKECSKTSIRMLPSSLNKGVVEADRLPTHEATYGEGELYLAHPPTNTRRQEMPEVV